MIIKLSDYIMEQSISTISADDIYIEQSIAEVDVCRKLMDAYNKSFVMETFFLEADGESGSTGKLKRFFEKAWEAIKNFFIGIWRAITGIFKKAKTSIAEKKSAYSLDTVIKLLEDMSDEEKRAFRIKGEDAVKMYEFDIVVNSFYGVAEEIGDACNEVVEKAHDDFTESDARKVIHKMETIYKKFKEERGKKSYNDAIGMMARNSYQQPNSYTQYSFEKQADESFKKNEKKADTFVDIDYESALKMLKDMRDHGTSDKVKELTEIATRTFESMRRSFETKANGALGMPELGMNDQEQERLDNARAAAEKKIKEYQARIKTVMDTCTRVTNDIMLDLKNAISGYIETCANIVKNAKANINVPGKSAFAGYGDLDTPPSGIPESVWDNYTDAQKKAELARRNSDLQYEDRDEAATDRGDRVGKIAELYDGLTRKEKAKYDSLDYTDQLRIRKAIGNNPTVLDLKNALQNY